MTASKKAWSIAVYQPKLYPSLRKVKCFEIVDNNKWIRPRNFVNEKYPLESYSNALYTVYKQRRKEFQRWLHVADTYKTVYLCCWCPYDSAAQRQLIEHGSYVCHSAVVEWFLRKEFGVECQRDDDRSKMVTLPWQRPKTVVFRKQKEAI